MIDEDKKSSWPSPPDLNIRIEGLLHPEKGQRRWQLPYWQVRLERSSNRLHGFNIVTLPREEAVPQEVISAGHRLSSYEEKPVNNGRGCLLCSVLQSEPGSPLLELTLMTGNDPSCLPPLPVSVNHRKHNTPSYPLRGLCHMGKTSAVQKGLSDAPEPKNHKIMIYWIFYFPALTVSAGPKQILYMEVTCVVHTSRVLCPLHEFSPDRSGDLGGNHRLPSHRW